MKKLLYYSNKIRFASDMIGAKKPPKSTKKKDSNGNRNNDNVVESSSKSNYHYSTPKSAKSEGLIMQAKETLSLFAKPPPVSPVFRLDSLANVERFMASVSKLDLKTAVFACDTEVRGLDLKKKGPVKQGEMICASIYAGPDVDLGGGVGAAVWIDCLSLQKDMESSLTNAITTSSSSSSSSSSSKVNGITTLSKFFSNPDAKKVFHNFGFDRHILENHGVVVEGFAGDTLHMARLWDSSRLNGYSLEALTLNLMRYEKQTLMQMFGQPVLKAMMAKKAPKKSQQQKLLPTSLVIVDENALTDHISTWKLMLKDMQKKKKKAEKEETIANSDNPAVLTKEDVRLDLDELLKLQKTVKKMKDDISVGKSPKISINSYKRALNVIGVKIDEKLPQDELFLGLSTMLDDGDDGEVDDKENSLLLDRFNDDDDDDGGGGGDDVDGGEDVTDDDNNNDDAITVISGKDIYEIFQDETTSSSSNSDEDGKETGVVKSKKKTRYILPDLLLLQQHSLDIVRNQWVSYSVSDVVADWFLFHVLKEELLCRYINPQLGFKDAKQALELSNLWQLYTTNWLPFGKLLTDMESRGIKVDKEKLAAKEIEAKADLKMHQQLFFKTFGRFSNDITCMNLKSSVQKSYLLFGPKEVPRKFKCLNTEGIILPGKKKALKHIEFELDGLGMEQKSYNHPSQYLCPISRKLMKNPVLSTADGIVYDKDELFQWLERFGNVSPMTEKPFFEQQLLDSSLKLEMEKSIVPKQDLKAKIDEYSKFVCPISDTLFVHPVRYIPNNNNQSSPSSSFSSSSSSSSDNDIDDNNKILIYEKAAAIAKRKVDDKEMQKNLAKKKKPSSKKNQATTTETTETTETTSESIETEREITSAELKEDFETIQNLKRYLNKPENQEINKKYEEYADKLNESELLDERQSSFRKASLAKKTSAGAANIKALAGSNLNPKSKSPPTYGNAINFFSPYEGKQICKGLFSLTEVSSINTLLNTFIIPLQEIADENNRIHSVLNIATETGRLSSRKPNLQNQPAAAKDRYHIRECFVAEENKSFVVCDYSQLELRIMAHMTNCKAMIDDFKKGGDYHSRTALSMYPKIKKDIESGDIILEAYPNMPSNVKLLKDKYSLERNQAKVLNFSIAYGKTAVGLAKDWNMTKTQAEEVINRWYSGRPEVKIWQDQQKRTAHQTQETTTLLGRHRFLFGIGERGSIRNAAERAAINTPIQGGAADVVMAAMVALDIDPKLNELGYKLLLQIHDEVILEGPSEHAKEALQRVKELMEAPFGKDLPLKVELIAEGKTGKTWKECK